MYMKEVQFYKNKKEKLILRVRIILLKIVLIEEIPKIYLKYHFKICL